MMIITIIIIITKITMMIRGETGGTHPHSSPVIRRPSKLSWHLTERTVTLCLQCDTVSHFAHSVTVSHFAHRILYNTIAHWTLLTAQTMLLTLDGTECDTFFKGLHTAHCALYPRFGGGMLNTLDSWATAVLQKTNIFSTLVDRTMHYCTVGNTSFSIFCFHQNHSTVISYQAFMSKPWTVKYEFLEFC